MCVVQSKIFFLKLIKVKSKTFLTNIYVQSKTIVQTFWVQSIFFHTCWDQSKTFVQIFLMPSNIFIQILWYKATQLFERYECKSNYWLNNYSSKVWWQSKTFVQNVWCKTILLFIHFLNKGRHLLEDLRWKRRLLFKAFGCDARGLRKPFGWVQSKTFF